MIFHLGVLNRLAQAGMLERVKRISTVSGGSLVVGLILSESNLQWPSSSIFATKIYPSLRNKICSKSLQMGAAKQLLKIHNLRYFLSRSNLLALTPRNDWGVNFDLIDLPISPEWSINGTTAETGRRFRFKKTSLGDYSLGYALPEKYPLANAMAVSAAFPGGFGPLRIQTKDFLWRKRPTWGSPDDTAAECTLAWDHLHLYDGGIYDNLGLEPFFDSGRCLSKVENHFIIASDASAPLGTNFSGWSANPLRLKRVADIMSEQSRALRVRSFHHYLKQKPSHGYYIYIAKDDNRLDNIERNFVSNFPTTLRRTSQDEFDRIANFAYLLAEL